MSTDVTIPRDSVALLIVDMQNGFCHPEGSFAKMTKERGLGIEMCRAAVPQVGKLLKSARNAGVPVIFTRYVYHPGYVDGGVLLEKYPQMAELGSLASDSWDAELVDELKPLDSEYVIDKSRYSSFYGTRLEPILNGLRVRFLVICGVTTNICVETTVRDASQRDYHVWVPHEATGELTRARHENALEIMNYGFAWVVSVDDVISSWSSDHAQRTNTEVVAGGSSAGGTA